MTSMRSARRLAGRLPENRILSHDLLEGAYARSGIVSDVTLFEDFPSRVSGGREPAAPVDAWGLADSAVAGASRAARWGGERRESDLGAFAVEDFRQSAAEPGAAGAAAGADGGMAAGGQCAVLLRRGDRDPGVAAAAEWVFRFHAAAAGPADPAARSIRSAGRGAAAYAGAFRFRVPAVRGVYQRRGDRANGGANAGYRAEPAGVADGG